MKKKETPEQMLALHVQHMTDSCNRWDALAKHGCNDPFWADGCNMNLTRNHILYYAEKMIDLCLEYGLDLPECLDMEMPPRVPDEYVVDISNQKRVERLIAFQNVTFGLTYKRSGNKSIIQTIGEEWERRQNGNFG